MYSNTGCPPGVVSDLSTQLVAGANLISNHLKSVEYKNYLTEHGIDKITHEQYFKGDSSLGSLLEICAKLTKRLIYGAIKTNIMSFQDFEFVITQNINLVNK